MHQLHIFDSWKFFLFGCIWECVQVGSPTLSKATTRQGLLCRTEAQLSTHHCGRLQVPLVITYGAPLSIFQHFDTALANDGSATHTDQWLLKRGKKKRSFKKENQPKSRVDENRQSGSDSDLPATVEQNFNCLIVHVNTCAAQFIQFIHPPHIAFTAFGSCIHTWNNSTWQNGCQLVEIIHHAGINLVNNF